MKRYFAAAGLIAVLALSGCQDNSALKRAVDENNNQIAALNDEIARLKGEVKPGTKGEAAPRVDVSKYEDAIMKLEDENKKLSARLAAVEGRKAPEGPGEVKPAGAPVLPKMDEKEYVAMKSLMDRYEAEKKEREKLEREQQLEAMAAKAKEYGLEFDPKDPVNSLRKLMQNRESREKVVEAARIEARKERYRKIGVDDGQALRLQQIEDDYRKKVGDLWRGREGRDGGDGGSREEREKKMEVAREEADSQVKQVLTTDQYKTYGEQGGLGASSGGWGGTEFIAKMFPGVQPEGGWGGGPGGR